MSIMSDVFSLCYFCLSIQVSPKAYFHQHFEEVIERVSQWVSESCPIFFFLFFIILRSTYYNLVSFVVLHFRVYSWDHIFINIPMVSFPALKIKAHLSFCTLMYCYLYNLISFISFRTEDSKVTAFLLQPTVHFTYAMILMLTTMFPACKSRIVQKKNFQQQ